MKKIYVLLAAALILILSVIPAFAADADYDYTPPEGTVLSSNSPLIWTKGSDSVSLAITGNSNYSFENSTDSDLNILVNMFKSDLIDGYKDAGFDVDSNDITESDVKSDNINGYPCMNFKLSTYIANKTVHQQVYIFTSKNHIFTFVLTCESEENLDSFKNSLYSFKINEELPHSTAVLYDTAEETYDEYLAEAIGLIIARIIAAIMITVAIVVVLVITLSKKRKTNSQAAYQMQNMQYYGQQPVNYNYNQPNNSPWQNQNCYRPQNFNGNQNNNWY